MVSTAWYRMRHGMGAGWVVWHDSAWHRSEAAASARARQARYTQLRPRGSRPPTGAVVFTGEGEICLRARSVTIQSAAADSDAYYCTGDIGRVDAHGMLYILGRCDEVQRPSSPRCCIFVTLLHLGCCKLHAAGARCAWRRYGLTCTDRGGALPGLGGCGQRTGAHRPK